MAGKKNAPPRGDQGRGAAGSASVCERPTAAFSDNDTRSTHGCGSIVDLRETWWRLRRRHGFRLPAPRAAIVFDGGPAPLNPEPRPGWLIDLLDPPRRTPDERPDWHGSDATPCAGERTLNALESELNVVAYAGEGERNDTLNKAALALFCLVAGNLLPRDTVYRGLLAAARHAGLSHQEAQTTIASAADRAQRPLERDGGQP